MQRLSLMFCLIISFSSHAELQVSQATVRLLPPGLPNTSAYFVIENHGQVTRNVIGAFTTIAELAELHKHFIHENMMRMKKLDNVAIGPGQKVVFSAGNLHMMIFGLKQPLYIGQSVKLGLQMEDGEQITFMATVGEPNQNSHN
ncbi:MAG: copper(I)-binding protein [Paraglaciecola sp.]|jgi:copper(I)-binding protein